MKLDKTSKKVYSIIIKSIQISCKIDTIFIDSKNSTTSDSHRLALNLTDKRNFKRTDKYIALSNLYIALLVSTRHGKI